MEEQSVQVKSMESLFKDFNVGREETKHQFEYQETCEDLQKDFSKLVWTLPFKPFVTEYKLKKAGEIARRRGIKDFRYLVGVIKKLP